MFGVLFNVAAVVFGSSIGLLLKRGIPKRLADAMMLGIGLCTVYIGIDGSLKGENTIVLILSMVIGILIGEGANLDDKLNSFAKWLEVKFQPKDGREVSIAQGFVTACLLFCVGSMTIVGCLQAGISNDNTMLVTKSILDLFSSCVLASTLGIGVLLSAAFVLVFQGTITIFAQWVAPFLGDAVVAEMTCIGSVLIIALGLNLLGITKLKVMNYVPAVFLPIVLVPLYDYVVEHGAFIFEAVNRLF